MTFFATFLLLALLLSPHLALTPVLAVPERSWSHTLTVLAGDSELITGGIDFATNIVVQGTVKVQSCCGLSTNDINFLIRGVDHPGQSFGVVVDTLAFEWDSDQNDRYDFVFDNRWLVCGGDPYICEWDDTSPSFHNKTVELNVTEVAPFTPYVFTILRLWSPVIAVLSVAGGVLAMMLLRKRSRGSES